MNIFKHPELWIVSSIVLLGLFFLDRGISHWLRTSAWEKSYDIYRLMFIGLVDSRPRLKNLMETLYLRGEKVYLRSEGFYLRIKILILRSEFFILRLKFRYLRLRIYVRGVLRGTHKFSPNAQDDRREAFGPSTC